jgi:hypothetical protein
LYEHSATSLQRQTETDEVCMTMCRHEQIKERLRAEYLEMPGMRLKLEQVQRLCGIEKSLCKEALDALVDAKFLRVKSDGSYVLFGHQAA